MPLMRMQIERFKQAYPGVELKVNYHGMGMHDKYDSMLQAALMGQGASDVIDISFSMLIPCINSPYFLNLYDYMEDDDFYMNHWEPYVADSELKAVSIGVQLWYIGINKKFENKNALNYADYDGISLSDMAGLYKSVPVEDRESYQIIAWSLW